MRLRLPYGTRAAAIWGLVAGGLGAAAVAIAVPLGLVDRGLIVPVGVLAAVSASGARLQIAATRRSAEAVANKVAGVSRQLPELMSVAEFSAMDVPYPLPIGHSWEMKGDATAILAREIAVRRPALVVELGSGGSSLVIGLVLQRLGKGRLLTLDHEPEYAARTRAHATALRLEGTITVIDAPLVDVEVGGDRYRWYDLPAEVRNLERVDFLVVDGPPQRTDPEGQPRYPALPVLRDRLGPTSVVFVDDAFRAAEATMLERWLAEEPGWTCETHKTQVGTAILRRTASAP